MMKSRVENLAQHLTEWVASSDDNDNMFGFVAGFLNDNKSNIADLASVDRKLKKINDEKSRVSEGIVASFYRLVCDVKTASKTDETMFDDVAFWASLKKVDEKVYSLLQPRWEELEKLAVDRKLRRTTRTAKTCEQLVKIS